MILGGAERGQRSSLLFNWSVIENESETEYWSVIEALGSKVLRKNAAVNAEGKWRAEDRTRTYLAVDGKRIYDVILADYIVRLLSVRQEGMSIAGMRSGPFKFDDGSRLDDILDALTSVQLVRQNANGTFGLIGDEMRLGYLEELWRVHAAVSAECYRSGHVSLKASRLEGLITSGGVGQGSEQRSASRAKKAVRYASAAGVIDYVAVDNDRHVIATNSTLSRPFEAAYVALYRVLRNRLGEHLPRAELHDLMRESDSGRSEPVFGHDDKDRDRLLRILAQSKLGRLKDGSFVLLESKWAQTISSSRR
jgi:hypothetical protein